MIKKLVSKNVPPWRKAVVVQNKNSITSIYHVQILALLLKVCYNIKVILNFSGHNVRHRVEVIRLKNLQKSIYEIYGKHTDNR